MPYSTWVSETGLTSPRGRGCQGDRGPHRQNSDAQIVERGRSFEQDDVVAADTLGAISASPSGPDRAGGNPWLDVDVTPNLHVVARLSGLHEVEAHENPVLG